MNPVQKVILKRLVTKNNQKFSQLTEGYNSDDNIVYHLKQLLKHKFIRKREQVYFITKKGVEATVEFDLNTLADKKPKYVFVNLVVTSEELLLLHQKDAPTHKFCKFPGGKPYFGESMEESLERIVQLQTGLENVNAKHLHLVDSHFRKVVTSKGETLFDDLALFYSLELTHQQRKKCKLREGNVWVARKSVADLEHCWPEVQICLEKISAGSTRPSPFPLNSYKVISDYSIAPEDI